MSVELNTAQPETANAVINEQVVNQDEDSALRDIWNKNERDNGAARENGRFASPNPEQADPLEGGEGEAQAGESSTPDVVSVPLPANWRGKEEVWNKIPAELKTAVAGIENEMHRTLSDQGRQLSTLKPVAEVIEKNNRYFNGSIKGLDGNAITPAQGIEYLFNVQQAMDANPTETLLQIADRYGVRDKLAASFGQPQQGDAALRQEIAGLKQQLSQIMNPASIDGRIERKFQEEAAAKAAAEEINRLSKDKPFYSEIPESRLVSFIHDARSRLGDTASTDAVFNLAYDMAVHADPDLRVKAAAAKAAAAQNPAKVADAKRANGVNVTSTSSGKGRALTEDEELKAAYDRAQSKG